MFVSVGPIKQYLNLMVRCYEELNLRAIQGGCDLTPSCSYLALRLRKPCVSEFFLLGAFVFFLLVFGTESQSSTLLKYIYPKLIFFFHSLIKHHSLVSSLF